jgi:hypothetical protein
MTQASGDGPHKYFVVLGLIDLNLNDVPRGGLMAEDGGTGAHSRSLPFVSFFAGHVLAARGSVRCGPRGS